MKKVSLLVVGILVLSGFGASAISEGSNKEMIALESITFSEPIIQEHDQYVEVRLDEATSYLRELGKPLLPIYTKLFTFPVGTTIKDVSCIFPYIEEITLSKEVMPASEPIPVTYFKVDNKEEVRVKNNNIYSSKDLYPKTRFKYKIGTGLDGNTHVLLVAVQYHPLVYSPYKNVIYYLSQ